MIIPISAILKIQELSNNLYQKNYNPNQKDESQKEEDKENEKE